MGHTTKSLLDTLYDDRHNVRVYTSGGVLHSVCIETFTDDDSGRLESIEWKSFHSRKKAMDYASEALEL